MHEKLKADYSLHRTQISNVFFILENVGKITNVKKRKQEAFEKCWAHSPQRASALRITIHQVSLLSRRTPPAHRCPRRRGRQRQHVTEGTAMAPWNGPKNVTRIKNVKKSFFCIYG